jgi:hypothetical protein
LAEVARQWRALKPQLVPIYFIQAGQDGPIKIGTAKNPLERMATLQVAQPYTLKLLGVYFGIALEEKQLHDEHRDAWIRGEWFHPTPEVLATVTGLAAPWDDE